MTIYLVVFAISTMLFKFADKVKLKRRKYIDVIAIIILCVLAGLRSADVGTDTAGYLRPTIEAAIKANSWSGYFSSGWIIDGWLNRYVSDYEIGYSLTIFIFTKLFNSVFISQFVIEALVITPIYVALRLRKDCPVWLGMLVYNFLFFNNSLNMIRQAIAISFTVLVLHYWEENKKKLSAILFIVALSFHISAILVVLIIVLREYVCKEPKNRKKKLILNNSRKFSPFMRAIIAVFIGIAALVCIKLIIKILLVVGFGRYVGYLGGGAAMVLMPNQIISRLPGLLLIIFNYNSFNKELKEGNFYITMSCYSIIAAHFYGSSAAGGAAYGGRIAAYFAIYNVIGYSIAAAKSKNKFLSYCCLIAYVAFYWWFYYVYLGIESTVPYKLM